MIGFTNREIQRAWRNNLSASNVAFTGNPQRLLLFYAVECGLKAILMKRQNCGRTDKCKDISESKHNINKLLDCLNAGKCMTLPSTITMKTIYDQNKKDQNQSKMRKLTPGEINQMWRYGGESEQPPGHELESKLKKIAQWIKQELGGI
jgi:hypothetical protein